MAELQEFIDSFRITDQESREEYNLGIFYALSAEDQDKAVKLVEERLFSTTDDRAPQALMRIGRESSLPAMKKALA